LMASSRMSGRIAANTAGSQPATSASARDPVQGACSLPVNITNVESGNTTGATRRVIVSWSVNTRSLPVCVTITSLRIEAVLIFPGPTKRTGEVTTSNFVRSSPIELHGITTVPINNCPNAAPVSSAINIKGNADVSYFTRAATTTGTVTVPAEGNDVSVICFAYTCPSISGSGSTIVLPPGVCNGPFICSVGCSPGSVSGAPPGTLAVPVKWSVNPIPLPACLRITQFRVRLQLTLADQTRRTVESVVSGTEYKATLSLSNVPAGTATFTVTITPETAADISISGSRIATL
jgi:hypothetical protein